MTDAEAETTFKAIRWAVTDGAPVCPSCGSLEAYEARRPNGALRFRCKGCKKDFSITSGTLFASHKLPLKGWRDCRVLQRGKGQERIGPQPRSKPEL
jgi:transposase-like protein